MTWPARDASPRSPGRPGSPGPRRGIEIAAYVIGPGREYTDLYDDWARLREVGEDGCVLGRPDAHVAWRSASFADDPERALADVLALVLDRLPSSSFDTA